MKIARDDARVLAELLWDIAPHPGAAPIAVKINDALSASALLAKAIDVNEREYGALRRVLADQRASSQSAQAPKQGA